MKHLGPKIQRRDPWFLATCAMVVLAFAWMEYLSINHWLAGRWYLADVGNVQQALVNTLNGNFMFSPLVETNHYRFHFTPLLTALAPLTLLCNYPIPLITVYMLALACCPLPVYRIAREAGLPGPVRLALGFLFIANHFVGSIQLSYHFETLFLLLMLSTIALAATASACAFWTCAIAVLLVKEDASIWCACFALFLLFGHSALEKSRGQRLLLVCIAMLAIAGGTIFWLGHGTASNASFYLERAGTFSPDWTALRSFLLLVASTGGLCLFGGRAFFLLLPPAAILLSSYPFTQNLLYYYSYPFIPFLFAASVFGAARIGRWAECRHLRATPVLVAFLCVLAAAQCFMPTRTDDYRRLPVEITARDEYRLKIAATALPPNAPTVIQFGLWGLTPKRSEAWQLNAKNITPERYVFADLKSPYGIPRDDYIECMRNVMDEVTSGSRKLLHSREDIFVVGPAIPANTTSQ